MKTKKIFAFAGFLIFLSFLAILFLIALSKNSSVPPTGNNLSNNMSMCGMTSCPMMITLNSQEVEKHNSANDCWVIVNNGVYDLTNFLNLHSGGSQLILQYCGTDGSVGFNTKDGMGSHSQRDLAVLNQYYLGNLGQQTKS